MMQTARFYTIRMTAMNPSEQNGCFICTGSRGRYKGRINVTWNSREPADGDGRYVIQVEKTEESGKMLQKQQPHPGCTGQMKPGSISSV